MGGGGSDEEGGGSGKTSEPASGASGAALVLFTSPTLYSVDEAMTLQRLHALGPSLEVQALGHVRERLAHCASCT